MLEEEEKIIINWFTNHRETILSYGLTQDELDWLDSNKIGISTQYIGMLRLYIDDPEARKKLNEPSIIQFGGLFDSLAMFEKENIGKEELHYRVLVDALKKWIKNKRDNGY